MTKLPVRGKESRSGALVVSGLLAAVLCVGIGAVASQWLATPDTPARGASAPQEAIRAVLPAPAAPLPAKTARPAPESAEPTAVEPAPPWRGTMLPELTLRDPGTPPGFAVAPELERVAGVPRAEVQAVAGTRSPDAGANRREFAALPVAAEAPSVAADEGIEPVAAPAEPVEPVPEPEPAPAPGREACGLVSCAAGYVCCNASCGVCVAPGDDCDPTPCESKIQYPVSQICGRSTCSVGEVCCNWSCGTCVDPGESCSQDPCD
ncbi:MAG TPA: hypothetical protein VJU61_02640 [Polyangiaceae bacterium]|nr:hypothetical protein [Polyangiaceae bacterium]